MDSALKCQCLYQAKNLQETAQIQPQTFPCMDVECVRKRSFQQLGADFNRTMGQEKTQKTNQKTDEFGEASLNPLLQELFRTGGHKLLPILVNRDLPNTNLLHINHQREIMIIDYALRSDQLICIQNVEQEEMNVCEIVFIKSILRLENLDGINLLCEILPIQRARVQGEYWQPMKSEVSFGLHKEFVQFVKLTKINDDFKNLEEIRQLYQKISWQLNIDTCQQHELCRQSFNGNQQSSNSSINEKELITNFSIKCLEMFLRQDNNKFTKLKFGRNILQRLKQIENLLFPAIEESMNIEVDESLSDSSNTLIY